MVVVVKDYGTSVGKHSNCLLFINSKGTHEVSTEKINELHIYPSCSISSDAIQLCMRKDICIVFMDKYGTPEGEIVPFSGGSSPIYKRKQLLLADNEVGVDLVKGFICKKIENRIRQLKNILRNKRKAETVFLLNKNIKKMEDTVQKIQGLTGNKVADIRASLQGLEGNAGKAYFDTISYLLPEDMKFMKRQRNANDVYNAILNYLYGILYSEIKKTVYKCRLDPYIGIMHVDSYNKPTFVYDFIEGQRIICEEITFHLCNSRMITKDDFYDSGIEGNRFSDEAKKY